MSRSVFFLGDSHIRCIATAAREAGMGVFGGPFASGGMWCDGDFDLCPEGLRFHHEVSQKLLDRQIQRAKVSSLYDLRIPLVTTCGFHIKSGITKFANWWTGSRPPNDHIFLSHAVFSEAVRTLRAKHLEFIRRLREGNVRVIMVPSPPRIDNKRMEIAKRFEEEVFAAASRYEVEFIRPREFACNEAGKFRTEFASTEDNHHANLLYGHEIVKRLRPLLSAPQRVEHQQS